MAGRPRFLIDENLSTTLPSIAVQRGFQATHVAHRGLRAWTDWSLVALMEAEVWVLVTNDAIDFRGPLSRKEVHPGVIFILPSVRREQQVSLFSAAPHEVERDLDLMNTAIDVLIERGTAVARRYRLP